MKKRRDRHGSWFLVQLMPLIMESLQGREDTRQEWVWAFVKAEERKGVQRPPETGGHVWTKEELASLAHLCETL